MMMLWARLLLTLLSLSLLPTTSCGDMESLPGKYEARRPPTVIIVGSGISGVSAAHRLYTNGFQRLRVLEATGRSGGRIRSQAYGKGFIDLGAQWIHGPSPDNPVYQLASQYSLLDPDALTKENQDVEVDGHLPLFSITYNSSGKRISQTLVANITELYSSWLKQSQNVSKEQCDPKSSVGGFIKQKIAGKVKAWDTATADTKLALLHGLLNLECCISGTHSMDYVALCPYGEYRMLPGLDCTFPGGYESLVNQIKSPLPNDTVLFNKTVKTIQWNGTFQGSDSRIYPVQVQCEDGDTFVADHVIVTVSLGILKERASSFLSPPLPVHKTQAIQNLGFGTNNKIIMEFKEPFWDPDCRTIQLVWEGESPLTEPKINMKQDWVKKIPGFVVLERPEKIGHLLCTFIAGDESEYMETLTDDEVLSSMTALLRQFTGNPNLPPPIRLIRTRWSSEPYTRGSYSHVAVGSSGRDVDILAEPVPNYGAKPFQVLFAGEATHRTFYSTTHGALLSGRREAERLIARYQELDELHNKSKL
uniref:Amine oxidase domain-containing protein n=1 Tax=Leptobrachium leishanense TaxID=445787 RepID=A0A8C5QBB1_9ANUR